MWLTGVIIPAFTQLSGTLLDNDYLINNHSTSTRVIQLDLVGIFKFKASPFYTIFLYNLKLTEVLFSWSEFECWQKFTWLILPHTLLNLINSSWYPRSKISFIIYSKVTSYTTCPKSFKFDEKNFKWKWKPRLTNTSPFCWWLLLIN